MAQMASIAGLGILGICVIWKRTVASHSNVRGSPTTASSDFSRNAAPPAAFITSKVCLAISSLYEVPISWAEPRVRGFVVMGVEALELGSASGRDFPPIIIMGGI